MEWIKTSGRTLDDAREKALEILGVTEAELEYEVLVEPKAGLFGRFGGTEAAIRARVRPISRAKPVRRKRTSQETAGGGKSRGGEQRSRRTQRSGARADPGGSTGDDAAGGTAASDDPDGASHTRSRSRSRRRSAGADRTATPTADEGEAMSEFSTEELTRQADSARDFVTGIVDAMELRGTISTTLDDGTIRVTVTGDGLGLLVGPKGATLNAIEDLARTVLQRVADGHGARLFVDVGGYREMRKAALEDFTRQVAAKAIDTGAPQVLDPMSAPDRKIVHDTVASIEGVETVSEGEDPRRYVVIRPA